MPSARLYEGDLYGILRLLNNLNDSQRLSRNVGHFVPRPAGGTKSNLTCSCTVISTTTTTTTVAGHVSSTSAWATVAFVIPNY